MAVLTLEQLVAENKIQANTAGVRSRIIEIEVPQGQFFMFDPTRAHRLRLAAYEVQQKTLTADDISNGYVTTDPLSDQPAKPPSRYIPSYPDYDGYNFKVFIRLVDSTYGNGAWTQAQINNVDWENKTIDVKLPETLPDYAGNDHTLAENDTIDIRISYAFVSGKIQIVRETPENAKRWAAAQAWMSSPYVLNVRDQLHSSGRLILGRHIWAPQYCRICAYLTAPVVLDTDPDKSVTLIELFYTIRDMEEAEARFQELRRRLDLPYTNIYAFYVAQLNGVAPDTEIFEEL